jgi:uncharacterized membrane protein YeiB
MSELTPVPPRERVVTLDVLRGFAMCGVMIGNMVLYSGGWARHGPAPDPTTLDEIAEWFLTIFVHSKAQTLLTLLFGFGFAVQLLRAEERREPVMGLYVRRLVVLFALGALHVTLLWWGDVTWTYAVSGFGLLAFRRTSNRARVAWALGFVFVPFLVVRSMPEVSLAAIRVFMEPYEFQAHTVQMAAALRLAMTLAYVGIVVLLMQRPAWRRILRVLAPAGRMPLTTYFSQSLICTFLFYGWGLGWAGSVGVAGCTGLALAIFSVQLAICHLWLRRFRFGPLEWVWRSAVYLKLQPMRMA